MQKLKSIKLYFFSILKLAFLSFRNFYYKSNFYNEKLITFIPEKIFYNPSTYLSSSLTKLESVLLYLLSKLFKTPSNTWYFVILLPELL